MAKNKLCVECKHYNNGWCNTRKTNKGLKELSTCELKQIDEQEEYIPISDGIGIQELRTLAGLQGINKALNKAEFMQIISIYGKCTDRLLDGGENASKN